ncbi:hypothetical protein BSK49_19210 [Paenibacillus odorifer]|uniref:hypothetical protein n=1 Tax=Paenibacillus TaxID=44249 RepID=UPI00096C57AD|nr:hypothetical protein [Paenibacillus odorifer]OMD85646.1 hypothetical protein BSK49_19210 [Paenibacillus odorifer]
MAHVSKQALLNLSYRTAVVLEFKGGWVRKKGESKWFRWIQMYRHLSYQLKKEAQNESANTIN